MSEQAFNPDNYMENAEGALVPKDKINPLDIIRNDMVLEIMRQAKQASAVMAVFKMDAMNSVADFVSLSASEYGKTIGGKKGNVTLFSYDGKYKLQRAMSDYLVFDERLQVAKEIIDECLTEWTAGGRDEVKAIINLAFKTNSDGQVSTARIIGLKRLDIQDARWLMAMKAISDSMQVLDTKSYLRIYERDENGQYQPISLDMAAV